MTVGQMIDTEYTDDNVSSVNDADTHWDIMMASGWSISINKEQHSEEPKAGARIRLYGKGIGYRIRGIVIGTKTVYYRSAEDDEAEHNAEIQRSNDRKKIEYENKLPVLEAKIAKMPKEFQERIARFRRNNKDFWQFAEYEIFVCEQAVIMARACGTLEALKEFNDLSYESQLTRIPELAQDHSGNTFGSAVRLAGLFLKNPELVDKMHGAMCPLVGCKDYGCFAAEQSST